MPHQLLFTSGIQRTGSKLLEWNNRQAEKYAIDRYGSVWGRCLANFAAAAVERQLRLEQDVIVGEDEDLMAFKQSLAGELSMIAVAVRAEASRRLSAEIPPPRDQQMLMMRN